MSQNKKYRKKERKCGERKTGGKGGKKKERDRNEGKVKE